MAKQRNKKKQKIIAKNTAEINLFVHRDEFVLKK